MKPGPELAKRASPMRALDACRRLAAELWRAERSPEGFFVSGLNNEAAVRSRLRRVASDMERLPAMSDGLRYALAEIHFEDDDPLSILERTERLVTERLPAAYVSTTEIFEGADGLSRRIVQLLLIQCLAGRQGRWAVRADEIPDARTARALFEGMGRSEWIQYSALIRAAGVLWGQDRCRHAAVALLDADRLVRTPNGLVQASRAFHRAGDQVAALWTVRVALLESESAFEGREAYLEARHLELDLRDLVESHREEPLSITEEILLTGVHSPGFLPAADEILFSRDETPSLVLASRDEADTPPFGERALTHEPSSPFSIDPMAAFGLVQPRATTPLPGAPRSGQGAPEADTTEARFNSFFREAGWMGPAPEGRRAGLRPPAQLLSDTFAIDPILGPRPGSATDARTGTSRLSRTTKTIPIAVELVTSEVSPEAPKASAFEEATEVPPERPGALPEMPLYALSGLGAGEGREWAEDDDAGRDPTPPAGTARRVLFDFSDQIPTRPLVQRPRGRGPTGAT